MNAPKKINHTNYNLMKNSIDILKEEMMNCLYDDYFCVEEVVNQAFVEVDNLLHEFAINHSINNLKIKEL